MRPRTARWMPVSVVAAALPPSITRVSFYPHPMASLQPCLVRYGSPSRLSPPAHATCVLLSSSGAACSVLLAPRSVLSAEHVFQVVRLISRCSRRHFFHGPPPPNPMRATARCNRHHTACAFLRFSTTISGGGYVFAQEQKTETQEEFNERIENPGAP